MYLRKKRRELTYEIGDTLTYVANGGERRTGVVKCKYDDIKNGRPGFDLENDFWGYDSQVTKVQRTSVA